MLQGFFFNREAPYSFYGIVRAFSFVDKGVCKVVLTVFGLVPIGPCKKLGTYGTCSPESFEPKP